MTLFDWIVAAIVIISLVYVSFVLTLKEYFDALRKGQAVTLLPARGGRDAPLWANAAFMVLGLLLAAGMFYYLWIPLVNLPALLARVLDLGGLALYLAGLWFTLWARRTLGKYWGISTSRQVKLLDDHQLVQGGPYAFVRHPMYFGWWLSMLGLTFIYPVWMVLLMFVFSLFAFLGRARREDAVLAERFGATYAEYKKRTKMLIPLIY
jgi:protein-S-isoprenylcysteine O-methyltransferase Ste14